MLRRIATSSSSPDRVAAPGTSRPRGAVNLLILSGGTGMVGSGRVGLWGLGQAAVAVPVTSFQVVNRLAMSRRYSLAPSRWRPGRKCGDIPLNADRNRCAPPGELNFFMARSRARVG